MLLQTVFDCHFWSIESVCSVCYATIFDSVLLLGFFLVFCYANTRLLAAMLLATFYLFIYVPFFVARTGFYNWLHLCGETLRKSRCRWLFVHVQFFLRHFFSCIASKFILFLLHCMTKSITLYSKLNVCAVHTLCLWEVFGLCYYHQMLERHFGFLWSVFFAILSCSR